MEENAVAELDGKAGEPTNDQGQDAAGLGAGTEQVTAEDGQDVTVESEVVQDQEDGENGGDDGDDGDVVEAEAQIADLRDEQQAGAGVEVMEVEAVNVELLGGGPGSEAGTGQYDGGRASVGAIKMVEDEEERAWVEAGARHVRRTPSFASNTRALAHALARPRTPTRPRTRTRTR
eukprot:6173939-Pleurochrysis_carterae.AAC.1